MSPEGPPVSSPPSKKRCIVYVDGFNFYYGLFKDRPGWKWLNLQSFFEEIRPDEEIVAVRYFTALIDPSAHTSEKRDRQKRFLKALSSLPKIEVILGRFQVKDHTCQATCRKPYKKPQEKQTDVNIAIAMMTDAIEQLADTMVLVSGDTDLQPVVQWIVQKYPSIKVSVYIPAEPNNEEFRRTDYYRTKLRVPCRFLPTACVGLHQFENYVTLSDGDVVERPKQWT